MPSLGNTPGLWQQQRVLQSIPRVPWSTSGAHLQGTVDEQLNIWDPWAITYTLCSMKRNEGHVAVGPQYPGAALPMTHHAISYPRCGTALFMPTLSLVCGDVTKEPRMRRPFLIPHLDLTI